MEKKNGVKIGKMSFTVLKDAEEGRIKTNQID